MVSHVRKVMFFLNACHLKKSIFIFFLFSGLLICYICIYKEYFLATILHRDFYVQKLYLKSSVFRFCNKQYIFKDRLVYQPKLEELKNDD